MVRKVALGVALASGLILADYAGADPLADAIECTKPETDVDRAIEVCTRAIESGELPAEILAGAHYERGGAWLGRGDLDDAIADFGEAIRLHPTFKHAYFLRAKVLEIKGEFHRAILDLSEIIKLDQRSAMTYQTRGVLWYRLREFDRAIADYDRALVLRPNDPDILSDRGDSRVRKGDLDRAIADFDEALRIDPNHGNARYNRGNAWLAKGAFDRAITDLSDAIALNAKDASAYYMRAYALTLLDRFEEAAADYDVVVQMRPGTPTVWNARAWTSFYRGRFPESARDFARAQEIEPSLWKALWIYVASARAGDDRKHELRARSRAHRQEAGPLQVVALFLDETTPDAVLRAARRADPTDRTRMICDAHFYIGQYHLIRGQREQAVPQLREARSRCPAASNERIAAAAELRRLQQ
jgi:tetratricopeptide (TPR) repeat protein